MQVTLLLVIDKGDNGGNPLSSFFMNQALFCDCGLTAEVCAIIYLGNFFCNIFQLQLEFFFLSKISRYMGWVSLCMQNWQYHVCSSACLSSACCVCASETASLAMPEYAMDIV